MRLILSITLALLVLAPPPEGEVIQATGYELLYGLLAFVVSTAISLAVSALTAPNIKGPKQKDVQQGSDYGRPIPLLYGPSLRLQGTIIWQGPLVESRKKRSASGGSQTTYTYSKSCAVLLGQAVPGATLVKIWANKKLIYADGETSFAAGIRFYDGSDDQQPDPTIEAVEGVGEVPAYRHSMYVVFDTLEMAGLGPPLPLFEFEVAAHAQIGVDEVVTDIAERAGIEIDVSMLDGNVGSLDGYAVATDATAGEALVPLAIAYYFDIAEREGRLVAIPRGMDPVASVTVDDTGVVAVGTETQLPEYIRSPENELPQEVAVTYFDIDRDMQEGTQRATRNLGAARENMTVSLPLVLDAGQARRIAHRLLWGAIAARRIVRTTVSDKWLDVQPGDVLRFQTPVGTYLPHQLRRATRGQNGVTEWELGYEDAEIYNCNIVSGSYSETDTPAEQGDVGETIFIPMDTSITRDAHDTTGFYWVVTGENEGWRGAVVYRSVDGGTNWEPMGSQAGAATVGQIGTALADGPTEVWDNANTLDVVMYRDTDELESVSDLAVLNGSNVAWIGPASGVGGEIIQFGEAELIAARTYRLSHLLRGRRGTEWATDRHTDFEYFVLLTDSANLFRQDFGAPDLDAARSYKPVSVTSSIDDTTAQSFTNTGEAKRPWSPAHFVGRWDGSNNLSIRWKRRSRLFPPTLGQGPVPLGEENETYQLDFHAPADAWTSGEAITIGVRRRYQSSYDYSWTWYVAATNHTASSSNAPGTANWTVEAPIRTVLLADQDYYLWTAAAQTADGVTPGDPVQMQIRQRSAVRGFGHPALATA